MMNLNFASYAQSIKKGIAKTTNIEVTKLLIDLIFNNKTVLNKNGEPYCIDSYYVNQWFNGISDIPSKIKNAASSPIVTSKSCDYFEEKVITRLSPQKEEDTYSTLVDLIKSDTTMSIYKRNHLISLYDNNEIGEFLAETFLYAIQKSNKSASKKQTSKSSSKEVETLLIKINDLDTEENDLLNQIKNLHYKVANVTNERKELTSLLHEHILMSSKI